MAKQKINYLSFEIDKLTRSIENVITGDSFPTDATLLIKEDFKQLTKKKGWLFDWKTEFSNFNDQVFKLIIKGNPNSQQLVEKYFKL